MKARWIKFCCWLGIHKLGPAYSSEIEISEAERGGLQPAVWRDCEHCGTTHFRGISNEDFY